jgi:hypothetical protein
LRGCSGIRQENVVARGAGSCGINLSSRASAASIANPVVRYSGVRSAYISVQYLACRAGDSFTSIVEKNPISNFIFSVNIISAAGEGLVVVPEIAENIIILAGGSCHA